MILRFTLCKDGSLYPVYDVSNFCIYPDGVGIRKRETPHTNKTLENPMRILRRIRRLCTRPTERAIVA